jgi:hypothetical protein
MKKLGKKGATLIMSRLAISTIIKTEVEAMMKAIDECQDRDVLIRRVTRNLEQALRSAGEGIEKKEFTAKALTNAALFSPSSEKHHTWDVVRQIANGPIVQSLFCNDLLKTLLQTNLDPMLMETKVKARLEARWPDEGYKIDLDTPKLWTAEQGQMVYAAFQDIITEQRLLVMLSRGAGLGAVAGGAYAGKLKRKE